MATTDKIIQMQQQGMSDGDIIKNLRNEGLSQKDIADSLAQVKIKMAVSQEDTSYQESNAPQNMQEQYSPSQQYEQPVAQYAPQQQYAPQEYQGQQSTYPQDGQQYYAPEQSSMSIDIISDIVERIVSEKIKEINQKIKSSSEFKIKTEEDVLEIKERLKRIENTIDSLQKSVISKVGEFGQSTALIHKDLENLHGTVSNLMNPLIDNYNELKKINKK